MIIAKSCKPKNSEGEGTGKRVRATLEWHRQGKCRAGWTVQMSASPKWLESSLRWGHPILELSVNPLSSFLSWTEVFAFPFLPLPFSLSLWEFLTVYTCSAFMWKWIRKQKGKLFSFPIAFWQGNEVDMEWVPPHLYRDFPFKVKGLFYVSVWRYNPESVKLNIIGNENHLHPILDE